MPAEPPPGEHAQRAARTYGAAAVPGQHRLDHPDRFWDVVLGSGYRATVDALNPEQRDLLAELRFLEVTSLRTDVVFGTAERPE
jgi:hypothetical protein